MRRRRIATLVAAPVAAAALALTATPAFAYDCIRASGSAQGLQQSTKSGNWITFTFADMANSQVGLPPEEGGITQEQADCAVAAWSAAGEPSFFALGVGVAGARGATQSGRITDEDFYELAKNAPFKVVVDGKGVDHLDEALEAIVFSSCLS